MISEDLDLVIIAGCQRSGTTLTGNLLGANPQAFLIDEPDGLYSWFDAWATGKENLPEHHSQVIRKAALKYSDHRRQFSRFKDIESLTIVLKAPNLTYRHKQLAGMIPRPVIIYPVRDSRDTVASMLKLSHINMIGNQIRHLRSQPDVAEHFKDALLILCDPSVAKITKLAIIWKIKTGLAYKYMDAGLDPLIFKYENLVADPEKITGSMTAHCRLEFDRSQLAYHKVLLGFGPGNTSRERKIDKTSLGKWRNDLTAGEVEEVLKVSGVLMSDLGYDC